MKVSVVQPGARLHYAVPAILARAGVLTRLYTDLHADHWWLRAADHLLPTVARTKAVHRLFGRRLPEGLPSRLVADRPLETLARTLACQTNAAAAISRGLLADLERSPLGPNDTIYTVLVNEDIETMARLKDRGVRIVHECIIGPDVGLHMLDENRRFPGLETAPNADAVVNGRARDRKKYEAADIVLVPSEFTRQAVAELAPESTAVISVPYGLDLSGFELSATPEPGRVLAVGSVGLRKGHPDLAAAARLLKKQGSSAYVRVVGPLQESFTRHPLLAGPEYVGQIPRAQVPKEFARADVLAFPTICDSFGLVMLEAMAMGVPVVCSSNCGDVVRDGVDGFVVPIRDPEALAKAIDRIVSDRSLREAMSANARERVLDFSLDAYGARLLAALGDRTL